MAENRTGHRSPLRRFWLVGAIVLLAGIALVANRAYRGTVGYWDRLDAAVARVDPPSGMQRILQAREGTTACVISCDEARSILVLKTRLSPSSACRRIRPVIDRELGKTRDYSPQSGICPFFAKVPSVGRDANVRVLTVEREDFSVDYEQRDWFSRVDPPGDGERYVEIVVNSGID